MKKAENVCILVFRKRRDHESNQSKDTLCLNRNLKMNKI